MPPVSVSSHRFHLLSLRLSLILSAGLYLIPCLSASLASIPASVCVSRSPSLPPFFLILTPTLTSYLRSNCFCLGWTGLVVGGGWGSGWRWGGWEGRRSLSGVEVASAKAGDAEEQRSRREGQGEGPWAHPGGGLGLRPGMEEASRPRHSDLRRDSSKMGWSQVLPQRHPVHRVTMTRMETHPGPPVHPWRHTGPSSHTHGSHVDTQKAHGPLTLIKGGSLIVQRQPHLQPPTDTARSPHTRTHGLSRHSPQTLMETPGGGGTHQHANFLEHRNAQPPRYLGTGITEVLLGQTELRAHPDIWGQPERGIHSRRCTQSPQVRPSIPTQAPGVGALPGGVAGPPVCACWRPGIN